MECKRVVLEHVCLLVQCYNQGIGEEQPWIQSLAVVGEPTAKSGGARGTWWPDKSTVSATCIVVETVQESLWNYPHQLVPVVVVDLLLLHPPFLHSLLLLPHSNPLLISFTLMNGNNLPLSLSLLK